MSRGDEELVEALLSGEYRALARTITRIENRSPGYRDLVAALHEHTGDAEVIGITGSPGAGKSTLVDKLAKAYRDEGLTVGVIAVDPSSPYTGGAVLGDRIRMASTTGDMDTFVRSMSARGQLGGLSTATGDAITAFDAFGIDRIVVETVGAGQNEVDIVRTADTVAVLVQPESGDDIQMLKAGILEIGDVFVVNKADMPGADRTVKQLSEMLEGRAEREQWDPEIIETVATSGEGLSDLREAFSTHRAYLESSGALEAKARTRYAEEVRTLLREDAGRLLEGEIERRGGIDELVDRISAKETDPYTVAEEIVAPLEECLAREEREPPARN
ncbi:MAG: methylmalonyl Co-A mutase-associated GTPase MeaB [Halalkalicoccus sp.]